jgi:hypothetical protein
MCLCLVAGWAVPVPAAPRVVCPSTTFDFGTLKDTDAVEHSFVLENHGDEVLTFGRIRACCGATASLRAGSVAPGTNTQFDVKLSLRGRRGAVRKSLYVATNDPRTPHMILKLTGRIEPPPGQTQVLGGVPNASQSGSSVAAAPTDLVVVPQTLTLLPSDTPKPVTRYVALRSRSQSPFKVKGISLPLEAVVKSQTPFGKAGWRIEIGNLVPSGKMEGAQVTFITDLTNEPPISIPIHIAPQQDKGVPQP